LKIWRNSVSPSSTSAWSGRYWSRECEYPSAHLDVHHNRKYRGQSGHEHQIDVSAELTIVGCRLLILVECKRYRDAMGNDDLLTFAGRLRDIGLECPTRRSSCSSQQGFIPGATSLLTSKEFGNSRPTCGCDCVVPNPERALATSPMFDFPRYESTKRDLFAGRRLRMPARAEFVEVDERLTGP
jgi:hypothetical protein